MLERYLMTEEQKALREMAREFAEKEMMPAGKEADKTGEYPAEVVKKAAEMGFTTLTLPEKYGGMGLDHQTYAIVKEELARGDGGIATTLGASHLGFMPIELYGNDEQKQYVGDILVNGGLTAFGLTEAGSGSDASNTATTYVKDGDDFIINGTKTFITNGGVADVCTIFATKDRSLRHKGISAFIVPTNTPGFSVGNEEDKLGIRGSNTTELILQDVRVPAKYLLGEEGQGFKIAMNTLNYTRPTAGAGAVGNAMYAYEYALQYAQERQTFGKPLFEHQHISFMLADMAIQLETARQMVQYAARLLDSGVVSPRVFSSAKAFAADVGMKVCTDALQIGGGFGFSREYPLEKRFRDAKIYQIYEGTSQIQRVIVSGQLMSGK